MKIIWERIKENKGLSAYLGILIFLMFMVLLTIFASTSTGEIAFFQRSVMAIFCLLLGIPIFLLAFVLLVLHIKDVFKSFPSYFMKRKRKLTKKGKQSLKDDVFMFSICFISSLITFGISFFGAKMGIACIMDYDYLQAPVKVELYDYNVVYQRGGSRSKIGSNYRLQGMDESGKEYDFVIGKYPDEVIPDAIRDTLIVFYLPHSDIVMKVE